jgi:uncharacterized membrane protein YhaH (DUF805 family)
MLNSVKESFRKYATFYGRENRRAFLEVFFFEIILAVLTFFIVIISWFAAGLTISQANSNQNLDGAAWLGASFWGLFSLGVIGLYVLYQIASFVPWLALQARRLHDANFSAWWLLLHLLPFGALALFIMNCFDSVPGESNFENEGRPRGRSMTQGTTTNTTSSSDEW